MEDTLLFKNTCTQQRINDLPYRISNLEGFWSCNTFNQFFNPYTFTVSSSAFFFLFSLSTSFSFLVAFLPFPFSPPFIFHIPSSSFTCFIFLFLPIVLTYPFLIYLSLQIFPLGSHINFISLRNIICVCRVSRFVSRNPQYISARTLLQATIYDIYSCSNNSYYWRPGCYLSLRTETTIMQ
jgi:hypothetical protein